MKGIIKTWEMSGMGRGYEDGVQKMVWYAVRWLEGKPKDIFKGSKSSPQIYGIYITPKILDKLEEKLMKINKDCSGAQYHCAMQHTRYIHENGYDKWYEELSTARKPEEEQEFDLDKMELLPFMSDKEKWKN